MNPTNHTDGTIDYGAGRTAEETRAGIDAIWAEMQAMSHAERVSIQQAYDEDRIVKGDAGGGRGHGRGRPPP